MAGSGDSVAASEEDAANVVGEEGFYYVVKMVGNGAMCVVHRDLLVPSVGGGGGELGVGCRCDLGEEGEAQPAIILGAGSESALSVLQSCIKHTALTPPVPATPTTEDEVGVVSGGVASEERGVWGSELAALLSPAKTNTSTTSSKSNSTPKRSPVSMETPTKRQRLDMKQSPLRTATTMPTVVPSKPLLVGGVKTPGSKSTSSPGAKLPAVVEGKKGSREIDPPPPQTEKMDPVSQILCEVKEIRRSYSTLAGSLLIIRRNQEDIKNRLTEIGLSIVTNSSDPLILTSDPTPQRTPGDSGVDSRVGLGSVERVEIVPGDPEHPHTLRGINLAATFPEFDPEYLVVSRGKSCSRRNFAVNLVRYLFTPEEMAHSNCSGTRGKGRLEQERLAIVRRTTLTLWPVEDKLQEKGEWAKCIYSIDEACRRLNRPKVKKGEMREEEEIALETEVESFMMGGTSQI